MRWQGDRCGLVSCHPYRLEKVNHLVNPWLQPFVVGKIIHLESWIEHFMKKILGMNDEKGGEMNGQTDGDLIDVTVIGEQVVFIEDM